MKVNRFIVLFFVVLGFVSCKNNNKALSDGVFTGTGSGRNGEIEVSITVTDGKITDAKIINSKETTNFTEYATSEILAKFLRDQTTSTIDTVSGATITSNGLLDALDMAMAASQGVDLENSVFYDTECEVLIIGAGGAGLTAATEASSKGARVIVLEKMGIVGGNSNFSTGGINASYTEEQKKLGIIDSKEVFYNDTMLGGKYLNDSNLVRTLVDNSKDMVEWLQSPLIGADLSDVGAFGGATNKRIHRPKGGQAIGAHLVPLLNKAAVNNGAEIRLKNKVTDILSQDGKPVGVKVSYPGGEYSIKAKSIIIATGGFSANSDMVALYQPSLAKFATTNHPGATGDAFKLVEKFDAALVQMEEIQIHPTVVKGTGFMITEAVRGNGAILVNRRGQRFVNEMEMRDVVSEAILRGPGKSAFIFFDKSVKDSLKVIDSYEEQGFTTTAGTIKELADKLKINAESLEKTVQTYNQYVQNKSDADFERNPDSMDFQLLKAPFYAIEVEPAVHHTMGGLKINTKAQVINKKGEVIPGLFAAGEVTGGIHGAERLGGNGVADICIFGKIAADSALEYIKK